MPSVESQNEREIVGEIVHQVAELEGTTPDDLRPLYHVIETDALERLFKDTRGALTFVYLDYEVTVTHDRTTRVSVEESDDVAATTRHTEFSDRDARRRTGANEQ